MDSLLPVAEVWLTVKMIATRFFSSSVSVCRHVALKRTVSLVNRVFEFILDSG